MEENVIHVDQDVIHANDLDAILVGDHVDDHVGDHVGDHADDLVDDHTNDHVCFHAIIKEFAKNVNQKNANAITKNTTNVNLVT